MTFASWLEEEDEEEDEEGDEEEDGDELESGVLTTDESCELEAGEELELLEEFPAGLQPTAVRVANVKDRKESSLIFFILWISSHWEL